MIWDDNESCIKWLKNHCLHSKTKHIETAVLSIRDEMIRYKTLDVEYVPTHAQIADQLTKILTPKQHWPFFIYVTVGVTEYLFLE